MGGVPYEVKDSRAGLQFPEHTNCLPMKKHLPQQKLQRVGAWGQGRKQDWRNQHNQNITICQFLTVLSPVSTPSWMQARTDWFYSACNWQTEGTHASVFLWNISRPVLWTIIIPSSITFNQRSGKSTKERVSKS